MGLAKDYGEATGFIRGAGILPASKACKMHALAAPALPRHKALPHSPAGMEGCL